MKLRIQVLHNRECTFWQLAWKMLEELIREKHLDTTPEEVLIASDQEAAKHRFSGSPQIVINGKDIDPMAERITNFHAGGCRPYFYQGTFYDYPPREMVEAVLQAARMPNA